MSAAKASLWRRALVLAAQGLVVAGSLPVAGAVATEEKPRWCRAWDAVASCGADSSHYAVTLATVAARRCCGLVLA